MIDYSSRDYIVAQQEQKQFTRDLIAMTLLVPCTAIFLPAATFLEQLLSGIAG